MMMSSILRRVGMPSPFAGSAASCASLSAEASKTAVGRAYEEHSVRCMTGTLGIRDVVHVGLRSGRDGGIDAKGWWDVGKAGVRVLAQCKASRGQVGSVREMEGLLSGYQPTQPTPAVLGLFFASRGFTRTSLSRAGQSPFPLILLALAPPGPTLAPTIEGCYPNPAAVRLIHPCALSYVWKLPAYSLPPVQEWVLLRPAPEDQD